MSAFMQHSCNQHFSGPKMLTFKERGCSIPKAIKSRLPCSSPPSLLNNLNPLVLDDKSFASSKTDSEINAKIRQL